LKQFSVAGVNTIGLLRLSEAIDTVPETVRPFAVSGELQLPEAVPLSPPLPFAARVWLPLNVEVPAVREYEMV
jgi:hypothetical protein